MPSLSWTLFLLVVGLFLIVSITDSIHRIGPTEVGLVTKRFSWKKLAKDNPVAFDPKPATRLNS